MELIIKIPDEVYKTVQDGSYCGSLYEELKAAIPLPYEPSEDLISRSDALKAVDTRHEELLHHPEYLRKHCQIDLLGIKKHILAIPSANVLKPTEGDLISRKDLKLAIREMPDWCGDDAYYSGVNDVSRLIDNAQAVDLWQMRQEATENARLQGKWVFKHGSSDIWCSVCDASFDAIPQDFDFCPNCGAQMLKGDNNE